jgi:hypothetical protein
MVGRGLRTYPGKERLNLIDCVGVTGKASLCTAPSLLGIDMDGVPVRKAAEVQGPLFELPVRAAAAADCPESWIKNVQIVDLWAQEQKYNTHGVNWFKMPAGDFVLSLPEGKRLVIPCQDELGRTKLNGMPVPMQTAFDRAYTYLTESESENRYIWDTKSVERWGKAPASEKQLAIVRKRCRGFDAEGLTKAQASMILNRVIGGGRHGNVANV